MTTPHIRDASEKKTAVIIDDDPETRRLMAKALERLDVRCENFGNGETALEWLEANEPPDVIVMDVLLPRMSGFELGKRIRDHQRLALVPLLVTTARQNMQDEELALELRAAFLSKPFRMRDYLSSLERMLKRTAREKPPLLMVVDDDADILKALTGVLREESYDTVVAMNGVEALHRLRHGPKPDLILLDLMMPQMDGIELAERLRTEQAFAAIPVLLFSASDRVQSHAKDLGALTHVKKPVDLDLLLDLVSRALQFNETVLALG